MKLKKIRVGGYKALSGATFVVPRNMLMLIGPNGSGKSSILQSLSLAREFADGNAENFFTERNWVPKDVNSQLTTSASTVRFDILLEDDDGGLLLWQFAWGLNTRKTLREMLWRNDKYSLFPQMIFNYRAGRLDAPDEQELAIKGVALPGSVLSLIATTRRSSPTISLLMRVREWLRGITSLELLSPVAMRGQARGQHQDIGPRGQHLAKFLGRLPTEAKSRVVGRLAEFYPTLSSVSTTKKRAGWVDVKIGESFANFSEIGLHHVSDGFLRLLALCAIPEFPDDDVLVLLDEIEDGIDPHILPAVIERITSESRAQFIMTSHSPIVANFVRQDEIYFVGRMPDGSVASAPFQDFDSVREGLEYFGMGELWTMMDREKLSDSLAKYAVEQIPPEKVDRFSVDAVAKFMSAS